MIATSSYAAETACMSTMTSPPSSSSTPASSSPQQQPPPPGEEANGVSTTPGLEGGNSSDPSGATTSTGHEAERLTTPSGKTIDFEQFGDVANIAEFYPANYMAAFAAAALAAECFGPGPGHGHGQLANGGHAGHGHHAHAHAGGGPGPGGPPPPSLGDFYPAHDFGGYPMPPMNHHGPPYLPPDYGKLLFFFSWDGTRGFFKTRTVIQKPFFFLFEITLLVLGSLKQAYVDPITVAVGWWPPLERGGTAIQLINLMCIY